MSLINTVASVAKINSVWCPINQVRQMSTIPDDASLPNKRPPPPWSRKIPVVSNSARKERTPQHTMHSFTHFLRLKDIRSSPLSVGACSTRFTHHGRQRILNATANELGAVYNFQDAIYRSSAYTNSKINVKIGRNRQIWPQALLPKTSKWCSQRCQIYCDGCLRIIDFHVSLVAATHLVLMSRKRFITRPRFMWRRFMWRSTVTAKSDHNPHLDDARSGAEFMFASESLIFE